MMDAHEGEALYRQVVDELGPWIVRQVSGEAHGPYAGLLVIARSGDRAIAIKGLRTLGEALRQ